MIWVSGFAFNQKIVERLGIGRGRQFFALRRRQANQAVPMCWSSDDPAQRGYFLQQPGHHTVGCDHEVFDQVGGAVFLRFHYADHPLTQK